MERRVSPRTKISAPLGIVRGDARHRARCVELSQTGLLARMPKLLRECAWPYARAELGLPTGPVTLLLRRVTVRGSFAAYALIVLDEASEERLTDFLFDQMHSRADFGHGRRRSRGTSCLA